MALSGNQRPDHSTIAAFVSCMKAEILPLFRDILLVCEQENLLGGTFFALDGLKLPGNASKRWSGTQLQKKLSTAQTTLANLSVKMRDNGHDHRYTPPAIASIIHGLHN